MGGAVERADGTIAGVRGRVCQMHAAPALAAVLADATVCIVRSTDRFRACGPEGAAALLPKALQSKVSAGIEPRDNEKSRLDPICTHATTGGIDSWLALDDDDCLWPEFARWRLIRSSSDDGVSDGDVDLVAHMLRAMGDGWRQRATQ